MENNAIFHLVDVFNNESFIIIARITTTYKHYAHCRTLIENNLFGFNIFVCNTFKQINKVALNAQHHAFCFGITHSTVIFYHHRVALYVDKTKENESFIGDIFARKSFYSRFNNALVNFLHPFFCGERNRSYATHSTSI